MQYKKYSLSPAAMVAIERMNQLGKSHKPFFFVIDYLMQKPLVLALEEVEKHQIFYKIGEKTNYAFKSKAEENTEIIFEKYPLGFEEYQGAFTLVQNHLRRGDSFLVNLTKPTPIRVNLSLREIFERSKAAYQLLFKNQFVLFSPETFVQIKSGIISSHPMKGTISANIPDAENIILEDKKELAEHATIVDLIRNDISMVAEKVWVERFRYIDRVATNEGDLLQVSSEICGKLPDNYTEQIGSLLFKMLPAGSITGAPKPQTIEVIKEAEGYDRGYYTGVFGIFDGENLDSAVMIRFIENTPQGMLFKSGGGITVFANAESEYQELINKVYLSK